MNDVNLRIATGKVRYRGLKTMIGFMYNYIDDHSLGKLEDVINNYDDYIQAILLAEGLSDGKLVPEEIIYIANISDRNTFSEKIKLGLYNSLSDEKRKNISLECQRIIEEVPLFVKLSVLADKYADSKAVINNPTYSQYTFDKLKRLATYLQFVDDDAQPVETAAINKILRPVIDYYRKNHVKYSTERSRKGE